MADDGVCVKISDLCNTWNVNTGKCRTCYDGYDLKDGTCYIPD